jgi:hypothetical protein
MTARKTSDEGREEERRRRLAAAFGEVLPDRTGDERGDGWGEGSSGERSARDDEWFRSQVPPHHG